jgi:hypothetical protein
MQYNGRELMAIEPIGKRIKQLRKRADELDWEGNSSLADDFYAWADKLEAKQLAGANYETDEIGGY